MENRSSHHHYRALMIVAISAAVLLAAMGLFGLQAYQDFLDTATLKNELVLNQSKADNIFTLRQIAKEVAVDEVAIKSFVIVEETLAPTIELLEKAGRQSGATTTVIGVSEIIATEKKVSVRSGWSLEVRLEGSFSQVWRGVRQIEALPIAKKATKVELVRLTPLESPLSRFGAGITLVLPTIKLNNK